MDMLIDSLYTYMNETLKEKIPILVDTYVSQYGEEYRDKILDKISRIKIIPYFKINSEDIYSDLKPVRKTLEYIATMDFLVKIGILEPELDSLESKKIVFDNKEVKFLLESFFGQKYINSNPEYIQNYSGIYSFLYNKQSQNNYEYFQILKEKMGILKKLGIIDIEKKDYFEFEKSEFYRYLEKRYKQIAKIAFSYSKEINYKYMLINNIYVDKTNELLALKRKIIKDELANSSNKDSTNKNIWDVNILFSPETLNDVYNDFTPGLLVIVIREYEKMVQQNVTNDELFIEKMLENIKSEYEEITEDVSVAKLEQIINRFQYLFPTIKELKGKKLSRKAKKRNNDLINNNSIKEQRRKRVIEVIKHIRQKYIDETIELVLCQNKDLKDLMAHPFFPKKSFLYRENLASAHIPHYTYADMPNLILVTISTILNYEIIDHIIDHEIRHIIESYSAETDYKYGIQYYTHRNDDVWEFKNRELDEAYTDKLSIEACEKRLCEGKYIFSPLKQKPKFYYFKWSSNLNIILEDNEDVLKKAKMSDEETLYELLPYQDWDEITRLIPQPHEEVKEELKVYALKLKQKTRGLTNSHQSQKTS